MNGHAFKSKRRASDFSTSDVHDSARARLGGTWVVIAPRPAGADFWTVGLVVRRYGAAICTSRAAMNAKRSRTVAVVQGPPCPLNTMPMSLAVDTRERRSTWLWETFSCKVSISGKPKQLLRWPRTLLAWKERLRNVSIAERSES